MRSRLSFLLIIAAVCTFIMPACDEFDDDTMLGPNGDTNGASNVDTEFTVDDGYRLIDTDGAIIDVGLYAVPDFVDIDADGDLDLFIGEWWGEIWFYRNVGHARSPQWAFVTRSFSSIDVGRCAAPSFADIDNDGDFDLLIGTSYTIGYGAGSIWFYENTGTAEVFEFTLVDSSYVSLVNTGIGKPDLVDIDLDGDLDMFFGYEETYPYGHYGLVFYRNDGDRLEPDFNLITTEYEGLGIGLDVHYPCFYDFDTDGDFDLMLGTRNGVQWWVNAGDIENPEWQRTNLRLTTSNGLGWFDVPDIVDINGDGILDLMVGNGVVQANYPDDMEGVVYLFRGTQ